MQATATGVQTTATDSPAQCARVVDSGLKRHVPVLDVLHVIEQRAVETSNSDWIRQQSARALADLDRTQWDRMIRVIAAFRPVDGDDDDADAAQHDQASG